MKPAPTERETRLPRRWWFDPRLAIGLGLVVVSVLGVLFVVSSADSSVQVYAARLSLSPGDRIHRGDLVSESVRLGAVRTHYLAADDVPDAGLIIAKPVAAGELVPSSAVGAADGERFTSLVVEVKGQLPRSIDAGAVVDVWSAAAMTEGVFGSPTVLVSSATVVRLIKPDGLVATDTAGSVELLVPRSRTAKVLEAVANDDAISLVPSSIPIGG